MKNYIITVNGKTYDVTVEEKGMKRTSVVEGAAPAKKEDVSVKSIVSDQVDGVKVTAGAAGKVFKIEGTTGQKVKRGEPVLIIEAMKMEIPVVAPQDGVISVIQVNVGDAVEAGQVLAVIR